MNPRNEGDSKSPGKNPLAAIYQFELQRLAYWTSRHAEELFALTEPGPYLAKVDVAIDPLIYAIISDAARIQKLIVAGKRQKSESARHFSFREARARFLSDLLQGLDLLEVHKTELRNSLEHFDERLDDVAIKIAAAPKSLGAFVTSSICVWELPPASAAPFGVPLHTFALPNSKPVLPVRIYVASERTYYNMGIRLNFAALQREAAAIRDRLTTTAYEFADIPTMMVFV